MAFTFTEVASFDSETPGPTSDTGSWTPDANDFYVAFLWYAYSGTPSTPTLSTGNGMTWTQVGTVVTVANRHLYVFSGTASSPSAGATTITWNTTPDPVSASVSIVEVTGSDDTVVQSATNSGTGTTGSVTLSAFASSSNGTLYCCVVQANVTQTPESGVMTELVDRQHVAGGGDAMGFQVAYRDGSETTPSSTWTGSNNWKAAALEIGAASSGVTITAAAGTLTLAGQSAAVVPGAVTVTAAAGALTLAGQSAAVVPGAVTVAAAAGTLTLTGQQAAVVPGAVSVAGAAGTLTLTGQSATVTVSGGPQTVTAAAGTLTLAGQQAAVVPGAVTVAAAAGALTLTGQSATVSLGGAPQTISAGAGTLTLAGAQATIVPGPVTVAASPGTLTLTGAAAAVVGGAVTITAAAGTLTLTGQSATVTAVELGDVTAEVVRFDSPHTVTSFDSPHRVVSLKR